MKAVLLVGGEGTRLRPLTCNVPKAMLPVLNAPLLEHTFRYLMKHGVKEVILAMGYLPDAIQDYFGDGSKLGLKLIYSCEQSPMGTAGAVKSVERYLYGTFCVLNGDTVTSIDLTAMLRFHRARKAIATIALTPVSNPVDYGLVEADRQGRLQSFVEKPAPSRITTNRINAGIYIIEPDVLDHVPAGQFYMFERGLFPFLLQTGQEVYAYSDNGYWIDIGNQERYRQVQYDLLQGKGFFMLSDYVKTNGVWMGKKTLLHPDARIEGPAIIGHGCILGPGVRIIGPAVLGDGCHIGSGAVIEKSILWCDVQVGERVAIRNSVVGTSCQLREGSLIEHDSVLSDRVMVASGCRLQPGCQLWPDTEMPSPIL